MFPPGLFNAMVHLVVHLPYKAKPVVPVNFRWMYLKERYLKTLKKYVKNKAKHEGCIT